MLRKMQIKTLTDWLTVKACALATIGKNMKKAPDSKWKYRILYAEHSPIRTLTFKWAWKALPSWVSVHFVRHHIGIEHFVKTQRTDRTGLKRDNLPQNSPVEHTCVANAQAIINISRKRLCHQASKETREAWTTFIETLRKVEPELASLCVPECIYRGFCPEFKTCGAFDTDSYKISRLNYINRCKELQNVK